MRINSIIKIFFTIGFVALFGFSAFAQRIGTKNLVVADKTATCSAGAGTKQCLLVSEDNGTSWQYFYNDISGFRFRENYTQKILVGTLSIPNPAADASSLRYRLIRTESVEQTNGKTAEAALDSMKPAETTTSSTLAGTNWKLALMNGNATVYGESTLSFSDDGKAFSATICNTMNGTVTESANGGILLSARTMTRKACPGIVAQFETQFRNAISSVTRYQIDGNSLNLYSGPELVMKFNSEDGNATMPNDAAPNASIENTKWALDELNEIIIKPGSQIPFIYLDSSKGTISGSTGCNNFNGSYTLDAELLRTGVLAMTRKACIDSHINSVESVMMRILEKNVRYEVDGSNLLLFNDGRVVAKFSKMTR
ncbi:MAG: META domain-containing protein [Pyrinomonadaceae bacterium]